MNERIKELTKRAGFVLWKNEAWNPGDTVDWSCRYDDELEKFAGLIVRECIKEITDQMFYEGIDESNNPGYYKAINRVEEHFGVEE